MGLATSQVRLLALTSRKADVEMQIQLNSKRKTMLTREATELSKLYYAKLQNSKIMYSTTNGNKEVNYEYLMAPDSAAFFDDILEPSTASSGYDRKTSDSMILTDSYGRVILSDTMANIVIDTLNNTGIPGNKGDRTVESMTLDAVKLLLEKMSGNNDTTMGVSGGASGISTMFTKLYTGAAFGGDSPSDDDKVKGFKVLETLYKNGYKTGGTIYMTSSGIYCTNYKDPDGTKVDLTDGTFYKVKDASTLTFIEDKGGAQGCMYLSGEFIKELTATKAQQLCRVLNYYGAIFSAAFSGSRTFGTGDSTTTVNHYNLSANIKKNADGKFELDSNETYYNIKQNNSNLQEGLKSGLYQLVNVDNIVTGSYAKAQGLNYFKTQNYVVEQTDSGERETITAWYNAARADLNTKESYWDSEITALSAELNSITTEIDSVKKLREDAISSTFKWGGA
ncbi:MAG: hypothetical protein ACI4S3_10895 [Candidatus Gastranaerophilaceae bacterium]